MSNWRDPVEERDYKLPPRPKDDNSDLSRTVLKRYFFESILYANIISTSSLIILCILMVGVFYISIQLHEIRSSVLPTPTTLVLPTPTTLVLPTPTL